LEDVLMVSVPLLTACLLALFATPLFAVEPNPPQLNVSFLARPAPIEQDGSTRLVYEMVITNFSNNKYVLDAVEAKAGTAQFSFAGSALAGMIVPLGAWGQPETLEDRTVNGGRSLIVFLLLDLGKSKAPGTIEHTLHVVDDKREAHAVVLAPLVVLNESPIVVAPPLRGDWIAGDSVNNRRDAAHRRAVLVDDGHASLAQRFAIDWVQYQTVASVRRSWKGPEDRNDSYFCYNQPIYSVAAGKVVDMADGLPDNVPHSGKYAITIDFNNAAGNHVVVEIAPNRYVLYAHMRPDTVQVKVGDMVKVGDILGHVGNTGSSTEPHLHMHIDDQPSFLAGNGVPYEFTEGSESGPVNANVSSPTAISFGPIGPQRPFTNDYPAENALVTFK
jgi:Peptidase family M23